MWESLFKLGGELDGRMRWILGLAGALILLLLWTVLAEAFSEERLDPLESPVSVSDRTYLENDSLLRNDYDLLLAKPLDELATLGLTKNKVYPTLPTPLQTLRSYKELHFEDYLLANSFKSIWLNLLGYLVAIGISIPLGFLLGLVPLFGGLFRKTFDAFRFIPLTAVTGIFVMWLGLDSPMKVAFLAFGIIVYLVPVVVQRIEEVDDVYLKTVFTLGATNWQKIRSVYLPSVLSRLSDDIRVLTAISWTYITIAEMLNRSGGIGELIWIARRQSRLDKAFAVLIVIVIIGILQDRLFVGLDRLLFRHKYVQEKK
ncbi:MAG: ABC transporter permease subunit [Bacteroidota bacterium]